VPLIRDSGVVLRTYKLGEADRIVVILCRDRGKTRAVAKGVRKTKSKFGGRLEPLSHVNLQFHEGRSELLLVTEAESVEQFPTIRSDLDRLGQASAMLEVMEHVAPDGAPNPELYRMLLGGLRSVENRSSPLVVAAFFLKVLDAEGVGLEMDACTACGSDDELTAIDVSSGGVRCRTHFSGRHLSAGAATILQQVLGGQLAWALNQPAVPATWEVQEIAQQAMEHHLEREIRSLKVAHLHA
jgi:DNA repair protein RecO (recombination protein O)